MESFSPMESAISRFPIPRLRDIAQRARHVLVGKSSEDVRWAQSAVDDWVSAYFEEARVEAESNDSGEAPFEADAATRQFFEVERFTRSDFDPPTLDRPGTASPLVPDWGNTSTTEALEACIDWFFDETDSQFRGWRAEHFFAALVLSYVEGAEHSLRGLAQYTDDDRRYELLRAAHEQMIGEPGYAGHRELSSILQYAFWNAMEATEASRIVERRIANAEKRLLQTGLALTVDRAKTEVHNTERVRRQIGARLALDKRHEKTNEARALVCGEWNKDRNRFPSAEQAGDVLSEWLELRGYKYRQRTVRDWIRAFAKAQGVTFR